jgi:hypothetical protein
MILTISEDPDGKNSCAIISATAPKTAKSYLHNEIRNKIEQIKTLHQKLELIYNKILNYIKIIRNDKKAYINNQYLDIDEIDNLIEQYNNYNSKKNKKIAIISTVFGKLQIVLEDYNEPKDRQYYHNI